MTKLIRLFRCTGPLRVEAMGSSLAANGAFADHHIGDRRETNYWEPIYGPEVTVSSEPHNWDFDSDPSPTRQFMAGEKLVKKIQAGQTHKIKDVTFTECDFQGRFHVTSIVIFDNCKFIGCDFAYSSWNSAHFKNCSFIASSLALTSFEKCEFRGCKWDRVGVSGNKTDLTRTFIENPGQLTAAMFSGLDPAKAAEKEHACHQWYRLAGTRAHVLRSIMLSHAMVGDEHVYFRTVELHELQRNRARLYEDWYHLRFSQKARKLKAISQLPLHGLNLALIWLLGWTNNWGESVSRPSLLFGAIFAIFGAIYALVPFTPEIDHPWQKSFDITLLIGFTNHNSVGQWPLTLLQDIHAILAVTLYTVFFATLISKLSRTR
nr:pentapeptide repeat-containing protein [Brevundimonas mediterranea]